MIYIRFCPNCKSEIEHICKQSYNKSVKEASLCRSCVMKGNCRASGIQLNQRKPKKDLTGKIFNNWEVISISHTVGNGLWYWNVRCINCGLEAKRTTNYCKNSKGCICCGLLEKGLTGMRKLMASYRESAKKRNLFFGLTEEQFKEVTSSPCFYCGSEPVLVKRRKYKDSSTSWGNYVFNGIDRIDNKKGYIFENCLPCCRICNRGKGAWSFEFWMAHLSRFSNNIINGKIKWLNESSILPKAESKLKRF